MDHRIARTAFAILVLSFSIGCAPRRPAAPERPEDIKLPTTRQALGAHMSFQNRTAAWRNRNLQAGANALGVTDLKQRVADLEERLAALEQCECRVTAGAAAAPIAPKPAPSSRCMRDCAATFGDDILAKADRATCETNCAKHGR